jgi:hypothetical protein
MAGTFAAAGICVTSAPLAVGAFGCGAALPGPPVAFFVLAPGIAPPLASEVWTEPPVAFGATSDPAPTLGVQLAPVAFVGGFVSPVALRIRAALFAAFGGAVKKPPLAFGAAVEPPFAFPAEPVSLAELGGVVVALVVSEAAFGPGAAFWLEAAALLVLDSELPLLAEGLFAGADGGCGAAGAFCGTFAGIDTVASRRAAKG